MQLAPTDSGVTGNALAAAPIKGVRARWLSFPPEVLIALLFLTVTLLIAIAFGLPFKLPSSERASFVGVHFLYPLVGTALWAIYALATKANMVRTVFLTALPSYAVVLVCHFNLKLWINHLNPVLWDEELWLTDEAIRPFIDAMIDIRVALDPVIPLDSNFYMLGFVAMFYLAFFYIWQKRPEDFRELMVAVIILQILGSIGYIAMPALGPFLYETGVESVATSAQASMYGAWQANVAGGTTWLVAEGGRQITVGLAAMPSLHTGASFLFLAFAAARSRVLTAIMLPLFLFIAVDAVANRWHYFIDLPVGMACAVLALFIAKRFAGQSSKPVSNDAAAPAAIADGA